MAGLLGGFLEEQGRLPFVWGRHDCLLFLADWVRRSSGVDPAVAWRGAYSDEAGARRIIRAMGGEARLIETALHTLPSPWVRTPDPRPGDLALIDDPVVGRTGAIVTGPGRLAVKRDRCVAIRTAPLVQAWTPRPCPNL